MSSLMLQGLKMSGLLFLREGRLNVILKPSNGLSNLEISFILIQVMLTTMESHLIRSLDLKSGILK